jgi:hypothetical protein
VLPLHHLTLVNSNNKALVLDVVEAPANRHDDAPDDYYISDLYDLKL